MTKFYTYGQIEAIRPTGRTRVRAGWFGRLILQIEIEHPKANPARFDAPRPGAYDPWRFGSFTFWRDAKLMDLLTIEPPLIKKAIWKE